MKSHERQRGKVPFLFRPSLFCAKKCPVSEGTLPFFFFFGCLLCNKPPQDIVAQYSDPSFFTHLQFEEELSGDRSLFYLMPTPKWVVGVIRRLPQSLVWRQLPLALSWGSQQVPWWWESGHSTQLLRFLTAEWLGPKGEYPERPR